jgi:NIPSNAP
MSHTIHEVTTLEIKVFSNASVYGALEKALPAAGGTLLGAFATDIGELSRVLILREFDDANALVAARKNLLMSANPLGCAEWLLSLRSESYALFPFLNKPQPGALGRWYEFRTYGLRQGLLAQTIDAWKEAMPAREKLSPLVGAFTALDGEQPRFLNIWAYPSLDDRSRIRGEAVAQGIWPPKGGPASLTKMTSWVGAPTLFSPLR